MIVAGKAESRLDVSLVRRLKVCLTRCWKSVFRGMRGKLCCWHLGQQLSVNWTNKTGLTANRKKSRDVGGWQVRKENTHTNTDHHHTYRIFALCSQKYFKAKYQHKSENWSIHLEAASVSASVQTLHEHTHKAAICCVARYVSVAQWPSAHHNTPICFCFYWCKEYWW